MAVPSNVVLLPLFQRLALTTNGTQGSKSVLDLNVPQLRTLLSQASALFLVGLTEQAPSTDFEWNVAFYSGFDRDHQPATPTDVAAAAFTSATPQGQRSADYTTVANFLLDTRLQLWWRNPNATGAKSGIVSAVLGVRLST